MCGPSGRFTPSPRLDLPEATDPSHGPASPENAGSVRSRLVRTVLAVALALTSPVLARAEQCPDDGTAPVPVEVTVTAVPIVVTSTTDDYFAGLIGKPFVLEVVSLYFAGWRGTDE